MGIISIFMVVIAMRMDEIKEGARVNSLEHSKCSVKIVIITT